MYINFWYPIVLCKDLGALPQKVRILSHDFVVFRDEQGTPAVLSDTCGHRGASLSAGKCKEDGTIQCPYHGWRYNTKGVCTLIPSIGKTTKPPPRARVDSYPVQEKHGIVFAFLGDLPEAERPPIMPIPEAEDPQWRPTLLTFDVNYYYERSIENGLDPAHNEYVHPTHGHSGEREDTYIMTDLRPHQNNIWGNGFLSSFDAPPIRSRFWKLFRKPGGKMEAGSGTYGPNHMWTYINFNAKTGIHQFMFEAPIDEYNTRIFLLCYRNLGFFRIDRAGFLGKIFKPFLNRLIDKKIDQRNMVIAMQDVKVINNLKPTLTPPLRTRELMMPADRVIHEYRDKLLSFEERGWRIDLPALRKAHETGDVIYAIPSPERRQLNTWVLENVPLIAKSEA